MKHVHKFFYETMNQFTRIGVYSVYLLVFYSKNIKPKNKEKLLILDIILGNNAINVRIRTRGM